MVIASGRALSGSAWRRGRAAWRDRSAACAVANSAEGEALSPTEVRRDGVSGVSPSLSIQLDRSRSNRSLHCPRAEPGSLRVAIRRAIGRSPPSRSTVAHPAAANARCIHTSRRCDTRPFRRPKRSCACVPVHSARRHPSEGSTPTRRQVACRWNSCTRTPSSASQELPERPSRSGTSHAARYVLPAMTWEIHVRTSGGTVAAAKVSTSPARTRRAQRPSWSAQAACRARDPEVTGRG
jgi:hypothetical protein